MDIIKITNRGRHIESTNYYQTAYDKKGIVAVSVNDGTFRLLIPQQMSSGATDAETVREMTKGVKYVIAARGIYCNKKTVAFIFDDGTDNPYMFWSDYGAFVGSAPAKADHGRTDLSCIGYVYDSSNGGIKEAFDLSCRFRWSDGDPDLREWT